MKREGRKSKCRDVALGLKKSLSRGGGGGGGGSDTFFWKTFWRHVHYGVGVPSAHHTDLRGERKEKSRKRGGGGHGRFGPPPPPGSATDKGSYDDMIMIMMVIDFSCHQMMFTII